jgi:hypothetical protein
MSTLLALICFVIVCFFFATALRMLFMGKKRRALYNEARLAAKLCKKFNNKPETFSDHDQSVFYDLRNKGLIKIRLGGIFFPTTASVTGTTLRRIWGK